MPADQNVEPLPVREEMAGTTAARDSRTRATPPSLLRNVFSNWMSLAVGVVYSLVITPIAVTGLQQEHYGVWALLNTLVAYSSLFYFGLGMSFMRYGSSYYATQDRPALNRLASVVFTIYSGIGVLLLLAGVAAAPWIPQLLTPASSADQLRVISATVMVLSVRISLVFVSSVFSGIIVAQGRTDLRSAVVIGGHLARFAIVPFALQATNPLLMLAIAVTVTGAAELIAMVVIALRSDRALRLRLAWASREELRHLYGFGSLSFLIQVSDRIISYTDTTLIGLTLGPLFVSLYVLPLQLVEYGRIVIFGMASTMLPHLASLHALGFTERMRRAYVQSMRATAAVAVFVGVHIVTLGSPFLLLWVGAEFAEQATGLLVCLGTAAFIQSVGVQCQMPFCVALGELKTASQILVAEAASNLLLSLVLVWKLGILGVAIGTVIPAALFSGTLLPVHVARMLGVPVRALARQVIPPSLVLVVVLVAAQALLQALLGGGSYGILAVRATAGAIAAAVTVWLLATVSERRHGIVLSGRYLHRLRRAAPPHF